MKPMTIGQLAKVTHIKLTTLRYYERSGLLKAHDRSEAGYRLYLEEAIEQLRFIKNAQALGFSLEEITELLALKQNTQSSCQQVKQQVAQKLASIDEKIQALQNIKQLLQPLYERCQSSKPITDCPIIEVLNEKSQGY